jgi:hypothetical protein
VINSIVYYNSATEGLNWASSGSDSSVVSYSCLAPDRIGTGNLVLEPQFVDQSSGDFHLLPGSPCIDAGLNDNWMDGAFDLDGKPRILNDTVDLGAYESGSTYRLWAEQRFAPEDLQNSAKRDSIWGSFADPDRDGQINLVEYALGTDPLGSSPDAAAIEVESIGTDPVYVHLRFRRRLDDAAMLYTVEVSGDLQSWLSGHTAIREIGSTPVDGHPELAWDEYEDSTPADAAHPRFIRVRIATTAPDETFP